MNIASNIQTQKIRFSVTNVLIDGYPKRLASVFNGAPGEIDAAFDSK